MYIFAYLLLAVSFICCIGSVILLILSSETKEKLTSVRSLLLAKQCFWVITVALTICSLLLLYAFCVSDFSLEYVAGYSSKSLPLVYRATAVWAGQQGSMLFWAWTVAMGGVFFIYSSKYKQLSSSTCTWFWIFFFSIMAFFFYILLTISNPFATIPAQFIPEDGNGLSPLLQNPGMVIHPPLLFIGYGGFTIPACLALAQALTGVVQSKFSNGEGHWAEITRPFIIIAWVLLTAGIVIGAWWAYMELGWGGYWAWDPVENASLLPWLISTAYLHTGIIEYHRSKLARTNIFLITLVTISAFFATYLVRSGVVASLHAFGDSGIDLPFLLFIIGAILVVSLVCLSIKNTSEALEDVFSREGLMVIVAWLLLALSAVILIATMWPVIMKTIASMTSYLPSSVNSFVANVPTGLTEAFYNRVCLPLFAIFALLLLICPHIKWTSGFTKKTPAIVAIVAFICLGAALWINGVHIPLALIAASASIAAIAGIVVLFASTPKLLNVRSAIVAHGAHIGLLLIILGVAFSGPYSIKTEKVILTKGKTVQIASFDFTLDEIWTGESAPDYYGNSNYVFYEASISVNKTNGKHLGVLAPQLRQYHTQKQNLFPEIDIIPSLGDELYASLISVTPEEGSVELTIYINPLVNWLWIGGTILALVPLWGIRRKRSKTRV